MGSARSAAVLPREGSQPLGPRPLPSPPLSGTTFRLWFQADLLSVSCVLCTFVSYHFPLTDLFQFKKEYSSLYLMPISLARVNSVIVYESPGIAR